MGKEDDLQRAIVRYLELQKPDCIWFAVPNGGYRRKVEAARMKGMGVRAGVADLCFTWGRNLYRDGGTIFVELKAEKGRQSPAQKKFQRECEDRSIEYCLVRSLDEMRALLKARGLLPRGP